MVVMKTYKITCAGFERNGDALWLRFEPHGDDHVTIGYRETPTVDAVMSLDGAQIRANGESVVLKIEKWQAERALRVVAKAKDAGAGGMCTFKGDTWLTDPNWREPDPFPRP